MKHYIKYIAQIMETGEYVVFSTNTLLRPREKIRVSKDMTYLIIAYV